MTQTNLKGGPLRDRTPVNLTIACEPELHEDLKAYADIHSRIYGKQVTMSDLVPSMLRTFVDSDTGFRRARRDLNT